MLRLWVDAQAGRRRLHWEDHCPAEGEGLARRRDRVPEEEPLVHGLQHRRPLLVPPELRDVRGVRRRRGDGSRVQLCVRAAGRYEVDGEVPVGRHERVERHRHRGLLRAHRGRSGGRRDAGGPVRQERPALPGDRRPEAGPALPGRVLPHPDEVSARQAGRVLPLRQDGPRGPGRPHRLRIRNDARGLELPGARRHRERQRGASGGLERSDILADQPTGGQGREQGRRRGRERGRGRRGRERSPHAGGPGRGDGAGEGSGGAEGAAEGGADGAGGEAGGAGGGDEAGGEAHDDLRRQGTRGGPRPVPEVGDCGPRVQQHRPRGSARPSPAPSPRERRRGDGVAAGRERKTHSLAQQRCTATPNGAART
mmetsp:Transcript_21323/g.29509  ORF Transcript_21323/g.29509 Transcript_21323/m.29509 type:complete len:368 (+) Transcript_21323:656-1759(+)